MNTTTMTPDELNRIRTHMMTARDAARSLPWSEPQHTALEALDAALALPLLKETATDSVVVTLADLDQIRKKGTTAWDALKTLSESELRITALAELRDAWALLTGGASKHGGMIGAGYMGRHGKGIEMIGKHARRTDTRRANTRRRKSKG